MSKTLIKSGIIVTSMTFISRILGLVRDMVIANVLGAGGMADVYLFANKIPNFLRRLFAEGAFAQAFIPVLTEVHNQNDAEKMRLFIARVSGTLGTLVMVVTIVGVIGSPILAMAFGTGWYLEYLNDGPAANKYVLSALMLKITFPYLFFITLTALSGAILNTLNKFAVAAFTPVLLNVAIIAAALWISPTMAEPAIGLAWGVFIGGAVQLLFQLPFLKRAGVLVRPQWGWSDPQVTKVRRLMIPAMFGVSVSQINLMFDTFIASFLQDASISWLYYSDRLLEFPLGLFGIAIATVILPTLSRNHVTKDTQQFAKNLDWGVKIVCLLGIPAAAGLIMLAEPMFIVLFERGAFTAHHSHMASYSLMAYASGLLSFMLIKVLAPGFFSRQDTKTPVKFGIWSMVANMVFNVIFAIPYGYVGLAIATSLSALLNVGLLYSTLHRTGVYIVSKATLSFIIRITLATLTMAAALWQWLPNVQWWRQENGGVLAMNLGLTILTAFSIFVVAALILGVRPRMLKH
ncbi:murein biosynthesis integral membrane protein MurJ [Alteromonadaceae bacterium BrNp21-10]|nr:murein biosynthesis integral membrane protein MurJ [Alteromonadaceae bacterium BrNp21-10]